MVKVAIVNQKGGCGKSTTALHYAAWCVRQGLRTTLIDADTQRSSSGWAQDLGCLIESEAIAVADDLLDRLPEFNDRDRVVIDAPAGLAEETRAILLLADIVVIPIQPSGLDLRSSGETFRLIRQARRIRGNDIPVAHSFLSRSDGGTRLEKEAIAALRGVADVPPLASVIHQRTSIADASVQRCTIHDRRPRDDRAIGELEDLCSEIESVVQRVTQTKRTSCSPMQ